MKELWRDIKIVFPTVAVLVGIILIAWFSMAPLAYYSRMWSEYWK